MTLQRHADDLPRDRARVFPLDRGTRMAGRAADRGGPLWMGGWTSAYERMGRGGWAAADGSRQIADGSARALDASVIAGAGQSSAGRGNRGCWLAGNGWLGTTAMPAPPRELLVAPKQTSGWMPSISKAGCDRVELRSSQLLAGRDSMVRRPLAWASGADLAGLRCWQGFAGA